MAAALIRIDQAGHPTQEVGIPGRSRDDIVLGSAVQLRNADDTDVRSHRWQILDQPSLASPDTLSNPTAAAPMFTPNTEGTYLIRLIVNEGRRGEVARIIVAVRDSNGLRIPAAGEVAEANWLDATGNPNPRGWQPEMRLLFGQAGAGGGGLATLYETDLAEWATADMNSAGATTMSPEGVTWTTPTAAADGLNMNTATTFGIINGTGLSVTGAPNSRITASSRTCQVMYAALRDIAIGAGLDIDPRRRLVFEAYVDAHNGAADHEWSGVAIWRPSNAVTSSPTLFGDPACYAAGVGFINGNGDNVGGHGGTGPSPTRNTRPGLPVAPDVACLVHETAQLKTFLGGVYSSGFPPGRDLRGILSSRDATDEENDIVLDPYQGFRVGLFHCAENLNNTYNANIRAFRILG